MPYLSKNKHKDVVLNLYVQPKASRNKIVGLHGEALKISITSPPVDGKANTAMTTFLAKLFKLPKSSVKITGGQQNRHKRFTLHGISLAEVRAVIAKNLP